MSGIRTEYEFVLPRGYLDESGALHTRGVMRLATARDELQPLRDPTITGPDDPRLTILVLARVVRSLGSMELVTPHEIEGLFAADLAYLQDFYGVINFGTPEEIDALLEAQEQDLGAEVSKAALQAAPEASAEQPPASSGATSESPAASAPSNPEPRPLNRRAAIQEVPSSGR